MGYHGVSCSELIVTNGGKLYVYSGPTNGSPGDYGALVSVVNDIAIGTNSWICPVSEPTSGGSVLIEAAGVTISAGGGFDAKGR